MHMKDYLRTAMVLCGLLSGVLHASPPSQIELNGFLLGQTQEAIGNALGRPSYDQKTSDGWIYRAYLLEKSPHAYMAFKFASQDLSRCIAIQINGDQTTAMQSFLGVKLGNPAEMISKVFGCPGEIEKIEVDNSPATVYRYKNRNYSFEFDQHNKLSSIQLFGFDGFPKVETGRPPEIEELKQCLKSRQPPCLINLLTSNVELYKQGKAYSFKKSARDELKDPASMLIKLLMNDPKSLRAVFVEEHLSGDPQMRIHQGDTTEARSVYKFPTSKIVTEVVYRTEAGRWKVFEVQFR